MGRIAPRRHIPARHCESLGGGGGRRCGAQPASRAPNVFRYFIPVSHITVTTVAPEPSSSASRSAATTLEPVELPANRPSSRARRKARSEEHTSELQSLLRVSYAVHCSKKTQHYDPPCRNRHNHTTLHSPQ